MSFHPILDFSLVSTEGIKYTVSYKDLYYDSSSKEICESHIHNCYEIYLNLSGDVSFLVNNRVYPIKSGNLVFTRPNDVHHCIYHSECVHEHYCLWIELPPSCALLEFSASQDFNNCVLLKPELKERLVALLKQIESGESGELVKTSAVFEIMSLVQRCFEKPDDASATTRLPDEMQKILNYINNHFSEIQYIKDVYDSFYISPATLSRWFRKYIGISPRDFLESKKLAYAKQLLNDGRSVTDAAVQAGFSDCSYFICVFKKKFGVTPKEFKRNISG